MRNQLEQLARKAPYRSIVRRFGGATICVVIAAGLRLSLDRYLGRSMPWLFFFPAVMFSTWHGAFKAGLFAAGLSLLIGTFFWVEPHFQFLPDISGLLSILIFAGVSVFMCYLSELWYGTVFKLLGTSQSALSERTQQLEAAHEKLQAQAEHLECLVEQRTAKLEETICELETFSYTIAHDLRGPLRAMEAYAEMLDEDYGSTMEKDARDYVRKISNAARRMDELIHDVLTYSRVVRSEIKVEHVDTEKLLREIISDYPNLHHPFAAIEIATPLHPVSGNKALLAQCLSNLLGNAAKFVSPGKMAKIRIWTEEKIGSVRLFIQDNGIGIPSAHLDKIFHIFERAHGSPGYEGTGIGLAIVKKAVEKMHGSIGVESELHRGSKFWLDLPLAK